MIRANAAAWRAPLAAPGAADRPKPDRWSALEYGCHVRDVFRLYDYRLGLMLTEDDPLYPNWDQDETAVADDYASQNPDVVAGELASSARRSRPASPPSPASSGCGRAAAATAPPSPSRRSRAT